MIQGRVVILFFLFSLFYGCSSISRSKKNLVVSEHKDVQKWIDYFTQKDKERFERFINRGQYYRDATIAVLRNYNLPDELFYLPLIESGYVLRAKSHAGAVGPWQFIAPTAKRYGLKINYYVDERRDPILSATAAAKYLRSLFQVFQSWELALAAYNCGERRVLSAIMRGKTRNFWELSRKKLLPYETRNYVPKLMAAIEVARNLADYQIKLKKTDPIPVLVKHDFPGGVKLKDISKETNIPVRLLMRYNPTLYRGMTALERKFKGLFLPVDYSQDITLVAQKLGKQRRRLASFSARKHHRVKRGESLYFISRKYNLRVNYLKKLNGLFHSKIFPGQKINITAGVRRFHYKVKKGDSLTKIARLYRKSRRWIKRKNALASNRIYVGQVLKI